MLSVPYKGSSDFQLDLFKDKVPVAAGANPYAKDGCRNGFRIRTKTRES